jgi:glycosyltransferase involved in cell wall biosynthesis
MRRIKRLIRSRLGWARVMEGRNKLVLAHTALPLRRFENREVRRLAALQPEGPPTALVAVVIPTFRRPVGLRRAVASVLGQTISDLVAIVVDDGGGLPPLPSDPRLIPVSLSRNVAVAGVVRNVGIRLTRSIFVAFLDDDNTWRPDHLEVALARLRPQVGIGPDAVYTALRRLDRAGRQQDVLSVPFNRRVAADQCFLDTSAFVGRRCRSLHFSRLRRNPEVLPKEDWEMIFRYSRRQRVEHVPESTVDYLVNPDSYWTTWRTS